MDAITPGAFVSPWQNEALVARLKAAWLHHSAAETARLLSEEFRITLTRNQVIGKLHRLGLTTDNQESVHPMARVRSGSRHSRPRREIAPPIVHAPTVDLLNLTLQDLETDSCRYVVCDDKWLFCGHKKLKDTPYCAYHSKLCYIPQEQRRRGTVPAWR